MDKDNPSSRRKTALVTGASSGIGCELVKLFARNGYNLILVARNEQRLHELGSALESKFGISVKVLAKDLSLPRSSAEIFIEVQRESIRVDVLVNNAGFGNHGLFSETDLDTELDMLQVNLVSLTHLTKLFLKPMLSRGEGKILNVASTAAYVPGPMMGVYYATKAYVLSFSESLSEELRGTGVTVTCLCPGPTISDFQKRANIGNILLLKSRMMDSKTVAEIGYQALMKNKSIAITGFANKVLISLSRFSPRWLIARIIKGLHRDTVKS